MLSRACGRVPSRAACVAAGLASAPQRQHLFRHVAAAASTQQQESVVVREEGHKTEQNSHVRAEHGEPHRPHRSPKTPADWVEVYKLGKIALPLLLQYSIGSSSHMINTSFVGHLSDPVLLSSMVLATSLSMATGYTVMNGVASASETLCGQAHGAKNYQALQATLLRALMITGLTCVPISLAWLHSESILVALGQPEAIAQGAARYLELTLPALYLYSIHECVDKYLLSQKVVQPSLVITAVTTALTPLFAWLFVVQQDMGLEGAAYAYVAVQACTTTLGLGYLAYRELFQLPANPPDGWSAMQPSAAALSNWAPYLALAVPAVLSYCMEGWATEVLIFLSGMLDNAEVAVGVTGLALQFSTLVWLAAASIGSATSTRVANKLGRGDAEGAKLTAKTAVKSVIASQALIGFGAYTFREPLLQLMTNNTDVIEMAMTVMPVLTCCFIADGLNVVQGSVLRGAGRQWWTAGLNIAGWWGVGVPLAYYLALVQDYGVPGLWAGFATASALQSGLQYWAVSRGIDWDVEVERAKAMMTSTPPESSIDEDDYPEESLSRSSSVASLGSVELPDEATPSPSPRGSVIASVDAFSSVQLVDGSAATAGVGTRMRHRQQPQFGSGSPNKEDVQRRQRETGRGGMVQQGSLGSLLVRLGAGDFVRAVTGPVQSAAAAVRRAVRAVRTPAESNTR